MDIRWLGDFLDLAETNNFTRTADRRHITQPALSRRIQSLENWVGEPLIDRSTKPIRLTPAGVRFRPTALDLFRKAMAVKERSKLSVAVKDGDLLPHDRERPVLLVAPLTELSGAERSLDISQSFAETLVHELTQSHFLDVVTSLPGDNDSSHQSMAEQVGADFVLEGTFLVRDGRLRVSNNLIQVGTATSVFSRANEIDLSQIEKESHAVATTVAWAASRYMRTRVTGGARDKPLWGRTAYENFVVGIEVLRSDFRSGYVEAQPLFEAALEMQPDYADAMAGLALCALRRWYADPNKSGEHLQAIKLWSDRALATDSENTFAMMLKCILSCYRGDFDQAETLKHKAEQISPNDPAMQYFYAPVDLYLGNYARARARFEVVLAVETSALDEMSLALGVTCYAAEDYEACIGALDSVAQEQQAASLALKMAALAMMGNFGEVETLRPALKAQLAGRQHPFPVKSFPLRKSETKERLLEGFRLAEVLPGAG